MEQDWLMRQFKAVGSGIGMVLKKELSAIDLGEIQVNDGETISREELLNKHLETGEYQQAFLLVNSLKYKMSVYEFNAVADWFIDRLKKLPESAMPISPIQIDEYHHKLRELL
ncbi:hypothetical protein [uncultured Vagococcus sp.]|uniref:hypothetical protein n=1 Tax=uncultured Vagococcus sp. TaxID=189676 RepID=UPI0028D72A2A|nr:hypothetical protein [uncultured Vagococcus sp.]